MLIKLIVVLAMLLVVAGVQVVTRPGAFLKQMESAEQRKEAYVAGLELEAQIIRWYYQHGEEFPDKLDAPMLVALGSNSALANNINAYNVNKQTKTVSFVLQPQKGEKWSEIIFTQTLPKEGAQDMSKGK